MRTCIVHKFLGGMLVCDRCGMSAKEVAARKMNMSEPVISLPPAESLILDLGKLRVIFYLDASLIGNCVIDHEGLKRGFKKWLDHGEPLGLVGFVRVEFYEMVDGLPKQISTLVGT